MKTACLCLLLCLCFRGARAEEAWQAALRRMPLAGNPAQLNQTNCVHLLLKSFQSNDAVRALVFLPGATDEIYLFERVHVAWTNTASVSLLDALGALTNQSRLRVAFQPPFLLVHVPGEALEPRIEVEHQPTADKLRQARFAPYRCFEDSDWDAVQPALSWTLKLDVRPWRYYPGSGHFYRHNLAAFGLNGWQAIEAVALANKTKVTVGRKRITFVLDNPASPPAGR
jgi:hypothetical protein